MCVDDLQLDAAPDYYNGKCGPTSAAVANAGLPLSMFFFFLPKELWIRVGDESNRYRELCIPAMAASNRTRLLLRQMKDPLEEIETKLRKIKAIKPHKIVRMIALLFARAVSPIRDGHAKHWSTAEDGAIPSGTFSRFIRRERFETILRFLHKKMTTRTLERDSTKLGKFDQHLKRADHVSKWVSFR